MCCSFRLHDMLANVKIVTTRPGLPYTSAKQIQKQERNCLTISTHDQSSVEHDCVDVAEVQ